MELFCIIGQKEVVACKSHELCYELIEGRGWVSGEDDMANESYYLYIGIWYRTISSRYWSGTHAGVICVGSNGHVSSGWVFTTDGGRVQQSDGGVQFLELCYLFI